MPELASYTSEAIDLLKGMIRIPSVSRDEQAVADFFCSRLDEMHIAYQRHGHNIWCLPVNFDERKPTILLNAHLDTVKPVPAWTKDPFMPEETDGRIYGLGSNDCGGGVVSLLQVFRILSKEKEKYNLVYLASCEEEVSGKNGIESVLPLLPEISFAIVGEPTGMHPAIAEKGLMVLDITAHGKAGHAARNEGENAIYKAMEDIEWLKNHTFTKYTDLLGPVKTTVTIINAGTQHNVVPDTCVFTVDVRSNECYTNEEIFDEIVKNMQSEVKARSFRLRSSGISKDHPFVRRAIDMGRVPFGSPTLSDQALMRFPSLKMGPGESSRSHTANEFIGKTEIEEAIPMYLNLLRGLCL